MQHLDVMGLVFGSLSLLGGLFIAVVAVYKSVEGKNQEENARHKERLALIEKGMDPNLSDKKPGVTSPYGPLLWGLLLTGVGFGSFLGYILAQLFPQLRYDLTQSALALLFGGLGLIAFFNFRRKDLRSK